jgi:hypothetical protein
MSSVDVKRQKSVGEKLLLAGGAATLALASGTSGEAAVVSALNTPISNPAKGANVWDVDGDSIVDFSLERFTTNGGNVANAFFVEQAGGRLVYNEPNNLAIAKLSSGFAIGSIMSGFKFRSAAIPVYMTDKSYTSVVTGFAAASGGWTLGDVGYFGFKFTSGGNTYYGWGELDLHAGGFTITQAYYNNTPGAAITAGDTTGGGGAIPEPSTCALALLAAGGVAAYKGRRRSSVAS